MLKNRSMTDTIAPPCGQYRPTFNAQLSTLNDEGTWPFVERCYEGPRGRRDVECGGRGVAPAGDGRRPRFGLARSAPPPRTRPLTATAIHARRPRAFRLRRQPKRRRRVLTPPLPPHSKRRKAQHTVTSGAARCDCRGPSAGRELSSIGGTPTPRAPADGRVCCHSHRGGQHLQGPGPGACPLDGRPGGLLPGRLVLPSRFPGCIEVAL